MYPGTKRAAEVLLTEADVVLTTYSTLQAARSLHCCLHCETKIDIYSVSR